MSKKKRLKPTLDYETTSRSGIQPTKLESDRSVSFSFRYWQRDHPKFSTLQQSSDYFTALLNRLADISSMTVREMRGQNAKGLRCHPIDWKDQRVTESYFNIPNEEQLVDEPYQLFQISANKYGRVHGFFIEDVAYIVWLDPNHLLYGSGD